MAVLISIHQLKHAFSHRSLFEGLTFSVSSGEKIALIGQNGAGKSTLMKIMAGWMEPDEGTVSRTRGLRVGYLPQVPQFKPGLTVREAVYEGLDPDGDWEAVGIAEESMSRLGLKGPRAASGVGADAETDASSGYENRLVADLSGGWQKKVALAHELAKQPDVLLLDEPTNHLDVESVLWLEQWIRKSSLCVLTISHDRTFLKRIASRVIEVDRRNPDGILSHQGNLDGFFEMKADYLAAQASRQASLENLLRRETEWLRRGAKARTTKQKARIDRAGDLAEEVGTLAWKQQQSSVRLDFEDASAPKKLVTLEKVSFSYGKQTLFKDLNLKIGAKTRLGLMGNNGTGKSTLIRLVVGDLKPTEGTIERSDRLEYAYFDQQRQALDPEETVLRTVCPFGETVEFYGRKLHVRSYLERFLFSGAQVEQEVRQLSGGEQARLQLAQLMLRPANLLILDEPTNDLDLQTLSVLEDCLAEFPGAVILVTHDRAFMDAVCDQIVAFPEMIVFSDLEQWEKWFIKQLEAQRPNTNTKNSQLSNEFAKQNSAANRPSKKNLSYKERLELEGIEPAIAEAEQKLEQLQTQSHDPATLATPLQLKRVMTELSEQQLKIEKLYERWAELETKSKG